MNTLHDSRLNRRTAQQLLDGEAAGPERLCILLAAAAAPAAAHETSGEQVGLAQFRAARLTLPTPHESPSLLKKTAAKLLAARILTATALATAATGGVALAAATNTLPGPVQSAAHVAFNAPAPNRHKPNHSSSPGNKSRSQPSNSRQGTPSPSLRGLCTAYQAGATSNDGKALTNPAFESLVTAAGGSAKVSAYCTTLIGTADTRATGKPTAPPSSEPGTHPTGKPTSVSSHRDDPHAAGKPTAPTHSAGRSTAHPTEDHPTGQPTSLPAEPESPHLGKV